MDEIVSAEVPSKDGPYGQELYDIVTKVLIHKPCGKHDPSSSFMRDQMCPMDRYPFYRRRNLPTGYFVRSKLDPQEMVEIRNGWLVPYNPYLAWKFKAHVNVQIVSSMKTICYITRPDIASATLEHASSDDTQPGLVNEITEYDLPLRIYLCMYRIVFIDDTVWTLM
ncbi:hypothetical protein N7535_007441 [Penicillium sp. DV-2018c]|nr:hypothetical protein N7461_003469 [Penicillium sp. DV-2018c]KAJ5565803.1 hypothetical protein N7535_007441 [Penicillium sp. DV-2018c]